RAIHAKSSTAPHPAPPAAAGEKGLPCSMPVPALRRSSLCGPCPHSSHCLWRPSTLSPLQASEPAYSISPEDIKRSRICLGRFPAKKTADVSEVTHQEKCSKLIST